MTQEIKTSLVISLISQDRAGIVKELSMAVNNYGCNIEDSRMMVLEGSFAILMMVSGSSEKITQLKSQEQILGDSLNSIIQMQVATERQKTGPSQPYFIEVVALDHQGIVKELSEFVASRDINIEALNTETYAAPHTGSTMFRLEMTVNIPISIKILQFKEELVDHCDQKNLDVSIDPISL